MDTLNEDCWLRIFKMIPLENQISMAQTCRYMMDVIVEMWQRKYKTFQYHFYDTRLANDDFKILFKSICGTANKIILKMMTPAKFEVLQNYVFSEVYEFKFTQMYPYYMSDDDILRLHITFPKLKSFSPQGDFTGQHITFWHDLEYLSLSSSRLLTESNLQDILKSLNLKTLKLDFFHENLPDLGDGIHNFRKLEHITLNSFEVALLMEPEDQLTHFKNLKEVVIVDHDDFSKISRSLCLLAKYKSNNVTSIAFCEIDYEPFPFYLRQNADLQSYPVLTSYSVFESLKMINFYRCDFEGQSHIIYALKSSKFIELVSLEQCTMSIRKIDIDIAEIVEERTKAITLNLYQIFTVADEGEFIVVEVKLRGASELFKITNKKMGHNRSNDCVVIELQPDVISC